jgi:hypothetical protein
MLQAEEARFSAAWHGTRLLGNGVRKRAFTHTGAASFAPELLDGSSSLCRDIFARPKPLSVYPCGCARFFVFLA